MKPKWKVVNKKDRGSIYACDDFKRFYNPESIVEEVPNSLGIMVFKTKDQAGEFAFSCDRSNVTEIVKVLPVGNAKPRAEVCVAASNKRKLERFYKLRNLVEKYRVRKDVVSQEKFDTYGSRLFNLVWEAPNGTQFYPAVKVLE